MYSFANQPSFTELGICELNIRRTSCHYWNRKFKVTHIGYICSSFC